MLHKQDGWDGRDDPTAITEPPAEIAERGLEGHDDGARRGRPAVGTQMLLEVQRGHGTRRHQPIARFKPDTAAGASGRRGQAPTWRVEKGRKAELGDKGYTDKALDILPDVAGHMFASDVTQKQLLQPVEPKFARLRYSVRWMEAQAQRAEDNSDTSYGGIADRAEADQAKWENAAKNLVSAGADEERLCRTSMSAFPGPTGSSCRSRSSTG